MKVTNINYTDTLCTLSADDSEWLKCWVMHGINIYCFRLNILVSVMNSAERFTLARGSYWPAQQFVGWRKKARGIKNDNRK
ncbi:hypothetical protein J8Z86_11350 [Yersinia enterocolitica]|uniref:hypothetical protein n=1 Tax=Yersinia enterocolitica TaxID=630 RepID=UPI001C8DCCC1|nr:hypothetical protein [Yersinia enterocolitica]MBX9496668.1 hypothetical protein [Yersinia enterocolitica]